MRCLIPMCFWRRLRDSAGRVVDFRFRELNPAMCSYVGLSRDDLLDRGLVEISPGVVQTDLFPACVRCLDTGEPVVIDDGGARFVTPSLTRRHDIRNPGHADRHHCDLARCQRTVRDGAGAGGRARSVAPAAMHCSTRTCSSKLFGTRAETSLISSIGKSIKRPATTSGCLGRTCAAAGYWTTGQSIADSGLLANRNYCLPVSLLQQITSVMKF